MIGLKKKQPFSFKNLLATDFGLLMDRSFEKEDFRGRLLALNNMGVQRVVLASEPGLVTGNNNIDALNEGISQFSKVTELPVDTAPSYWLDTTLEDFVKQNALITYCDKYVLLALRGFGSVRSLKGPVFEIRARGYEPIILHRDPKQYVGIRSDVLKYLVDLGCLLQLNLLTLTGVYGIQTKSRAEMMVNNGLARILTTGIRGVEDVDPLCNLMLTPSVISSLKRAISQYSKWIQQT